MLIVCWAGVGKNKINNCVNPTHPVVLYSHWTEGRGLDCAGFLLSPLLHPLAGRVGHYTAPHHCVWSVILKIRLYWFSANIFYSILSSAQSEWLQQQLQSVISKVGSRGWGGGGEGDLTQDQTSKQPPTVWAITTFISALLRVMRIAVGARQLEH